MEPTIEIIFDNLSGVYFPGQVVSGRVRKNVYNPSLCRAVLIQFNGFAKTNWTEQEHIGTGKDRKLEDVVYTSHEPYYQMEYRLWGNEHIPTQVVSGQYEFPFGFQLPANLPSSYESKFGHIRYICSAKLSLGRGHKVFCVKPISVNAINDLNLNDLSQSPILDECRKTLGCCCCKSGEMSYVLNIEKSGYVPGERIYINAECSNESTRNIAKTSMKIFQNVEYFADGATKKKHTSVCKIEHGEKRQGEDDIWSAVPFTIPALPPTDTINSSLIKISYTLQFQMVPSGMSFALKKEYPLIIGTVPLLNSFSNFVTNQQISTYDLPPPYESHHNSATAPPYQQPNPSAPYPQPASNPPYAPYPEKDTSAPYPHPNNPTCPYPETLPPIPNSTVPPFQPYQPPSAPHLGFAIPAAQQYQNMPLPSNEHSHFGFTVLNHEVDDHTANLEYAPKYVLYNPINQANIQALNTHHEFSSNNDSDLTRLLD